MTPAKPTILPWQEASERLAREISGRSATPTVVGITGPTGAGKSTLARALAPLGGGGVVVATDDYLPDYEAVPYLERDDPAHADLPLLAAHLADLRAGRPVDLPVWSFFTHRRESVRRVEPGAVIVVEGIHALNGTVRELLDLAVFVDAAPTARLARLEARERAGERGWPIEHLREHFREVAEPTFARFAGVYRAGADFVVVNG